MLLLILELETDRDLVDLNAADDYLGLQGTTTGLLSTKDVVGLCCNYLTVDTSTDLL